MSAYCCTGGQTMPAAISTGATKSGGLVSTSSGGRSSSSVSTPPSAGPGPRLGSGDHDGAGAAARHQRQSVVDHLLLGDADLAEQRARRRATRRAGRRCVPV